jgi:hypothetical protein
MGGGKKNGPNVKGFQRSKYASDYSNAEHSKINKPYEPET